MWKRSFRARLPWKSGSGRCENEAFMRDLPQNPKVADVKTKVSCETSLKKWKWKMWKRSFRARLPFVRDRPQNPKVADVKTKLSCETSLIIWKLKMWNVKAKLSCETSLKIWQSKMWKRSFPARLPQILKVEDVRIKLSCWRKWQMWKQLSCETSLKIWKLKMWNVKTKLSCETSLKSWMWKRSFRARTPSKFQLPNCEKKPEPAVPLRGRSDHDPGLNEHVSRPSAGQASPSIFRDSFTLQNTAFGASALSQKRISCETSLKKWLHPWITLKRDAEWAQN